MITIQPISGLCNYLRVIFSYYEYAKSINSELTVIWLETDACNGKFSDYFESVPNMTIVYEIPKDVKIYYRGYICHPNYSQRTSKIYGTLKLLPHIKKIIEERIETLQNNYVAVHIRRTDHINLAKSFNKYTDDDAFISFLDKINKNIYIATDNESTYKTFQQKYPKLIKFKYHNTVSDSLRHTSLQDAIIDIYMCVYASKFMGSGWSSFSILISNIRMNM